VALVEDVVEEVGRLVAVGQGEPAHPR
jgi:hypothetical protein